VLKITLSSMQPESWRGGSTWDDGIRLEQVGNSDYRRMQVNATVAHQSTVVILILIHSKI
jgi:hypothetical protein